LEAFAVSIMELMIEQKKLGLWAEENNYCYGAFCLFPIPIFQFQ
jgi:hypothetical protein